MPGAVLGEIPPYMVWLGQTRDLPNASWSAALKIQYFKINKEIEAYGKAFSPMAKRNLAAGVHEGFVAFEGVWRKAYFRAPLPDLLIELDAAARKQAEIGVSSHKYDYVSCLAYEFPTTKFEERLFIASWDGADYQYGGVGKYAGDASDRADFLARCSKMKDAIRLAYARYQTDQGGKPENAKTLKIFMAPEFYFRGKNGAYKVKYVTEIFADLKRFISEGKFSDWLFVLGTVIGASFDDRLGCGSCGKLGATNFRRVPQGGKNVYVCDGCPLGSVDEYTMGARIDNVALIQKGGETDTRNAYVVAKEYVSHVDFRRKITKKGLKAGAKATGFAGVAILDDWDANREIKLYGRTVAALAPSGSSDVGGDASRFADERMGGAIFTIDGIKFGLEVCLDHLNARIQPGAALQIQLVPSGGAFLNQFACMRNGIAFNVDGGDGGVSDVRVNSGGGAPSASPAPDSTSIVIPSGGSVRIYDPVPIPYA